MKKQLTEFEKQCGVTTEQAGAIADGVIQDTYDCSREGTRCVYGYYQKGESQ